MPHSLAESLARAVRQNNGVLPKKRRQGEFQQLRDDEVALIEEVVCAAFEDH